MRYGLREHTHWQRVTTTALVCLLVGLTISVSAPPLLVPLLLTAAAGAAVLALLGRWVWLIPVAALLVGLLRGATGPPANTTPPQETVIQRAILLRLDTSVGKPESDLGASLLVGAKQGVPRNVSDDFKASGLSHLLAVSGFNVTLVANLLLWVGRRFSRRARTALLVIGVAGFVIAAGGSASVVRAGVMGGIAAMALHAGRASAARRSLLVVAVGMALLQPSLVVADVGFQLSFAATAAILLLAPVLLRKLEWLPDVLSLRSSLATTVAATLGTMPIIMVAFGRVSLISVPANLVAAPLIAPAMALTGAATLLGGTLPGLVIGYVAGGLLRGLELVAHTAASVPGAQMLLR